MSQDWSAYTPDEHALFRRLYERQAKLVPRYACPEWIEAIGRLDAGREIPKFGEINKSLGKGGLKAMRLDAIRMLVRTPAGVRACGAGLLSSDGELACCVDDPRPRRRPFELERILRTEYRIDRYQETYFVLESFAQLMRDTAPDFTPLYARLKSLEPFPPDA